MSEPATVPTTDADWYAADARSIAGVERLRFFPQVVATGHGCTLVTPEGREVLDLSASWTATGLGHGHSAVVEAVTRSVSSQAGGSVLSGTHPEAVLLARELLELVGTTGTDRRVYLGHAGTDANDVALRGVRQMTGRSTVVAFENGYHGGLGGSMAVSGLHVAAGATADPHLRLVPYPDPFRPWTGDAETLLAATLTRVEQELAGGDVAAVLVEPIQSDGGVIVPPDGFLRGLRELTQAHGSLLVVDEVKVGLCRTGEFLAHQAEGVVPDLVTLGKSLGSGLPLSAVVGPAAALDSPAASALMTTIGNPVSCAAGRAVLGQLRDGILAANAVARGAQLVAGLQRYAASARPGAATVGDVRGRGLSVGVELVVPATGAPDETLTSKAVFAGWGLGIVAYPVRGNVIELTPPLTITSEEIDRAVDLLADAIDAAATGRVADEDVAAFSGW
ncbi:aspartate aminotransferase family protein [Ornithinimicrobium tianjinense]|uniref:Aspartate aminotransferase family protein n=1 Tax=Ornithinimicrobium tianjinense TaxID=1195761 RepID=A0A917BVR2_9MICO|nr:aminotransferase class III-fold pyridoxal phosphate-dependent enzyme [Ornithinimicrobium tianjinense]GGF58646.1 aspartate aminotransferase family protein [Ornithinimicrobium tianjinense]